MKFFLLIYLSLSYTLFLVFLPIFLSVVFYLRFSSALTIDSNGYIQLGIIVLFGMLMFPFAYFFFKSFNNKYFYVYLISFFCLVIIFANLINGFSLDGINYNEVDFDKISKFSDFETIQSIQQIALYNTERFLFGTLGVFMFIIFTASMYESSKPRKSKKLKSN